MSLRWRVGLSFFVVVAACSRTALDVELAGDPTDAGPDSCSTETLRTAVRWPGPQQASIGGVVIDPDDDWLVVIGGLTGGEDSSQAITAVRLGTAENVALTRTGNANVALGAFMRATWDPANHRIIGLGGASFQSNPPQNEKQVFALTVKGKNAELASLPDFPDGVTGDIPLAAAFDPKTARLIVTPEKGSVSGPTKTYALDAKPGGESWSLLATDQDAAMADVQLVSMSYDPTHHAMIALGTSFVDDSRSMWSLSLDAPSAWVALAGTLPPTLYDYGAVISTGFPLIWDDTLCAFVTGVTNESCFYEAWRFDVSGATFTATSLGTVTQPATRYGRGAAPFDLARHNFVFSSGFDCQLEHDYVAASVDFVPLIP